MMHESKVRGWRNSWYAKVLSNLPFIGGVFATDSVPEMLNAAGHYTSMIVGSGLGMMIYPVIPTNETDDMNTASAKMLSNMTIGATATTMLYTGAIEFSKYTYSTCKSRFFSNGATQLVNEEDAQELQDISTNSNVDEEDASSTMQYT